MSSAQHIPRSRAPGVPGAQRALADRALTAKAAAALVLANLRYWFTVARNVHVQLARWETRARSIPDPILRELALAKLREERFNPQLAATLATLAPRSRRNTVVEAIVALQVLYDFLDVLGEHPPPGVADNEWSLLAALTDAVSLGTPRADTYCPRARHDDAGYLAQLVTVVRTAFASLASAATISPIATATAARCARAQTLNHAASATGTAPAGRWAIAHARGTSLGWQEYLAGASASVLALHALIAAAADPDTTRERAAAIDAAYLSIGALTMLDSVVDCDEDLRDGRPGYLQYYDDPGLLATRLTIVARDARARACRAPHAAHHVMTLVGVAAYYLSAPGSSAELAAPIAVAVRGELRPLITPTLALMRTWRAAKRLRGSWLARGRRAQ